MTTPEEIKKNIAFNLKQLDAADKEIAAIAALRCQLYRDILAGVQQYVEERLAEQKAQQAAALSEVSR